MFVCKGENSFRKGGSWRVPSLEGIQVMVGTVRRVAATQTTKGRPRLRSRNIADHRQDLIDQKQRDRDTEGGEKRVQKSDY